jgi:hypothetical protein
LTDEKEMGKGREKKTGQGRRSTMSCDRSEGYIKKVDDSFLQEMESEDE